jgi:hypothetical protein
MFAKDWQLQQRRRKTIAAAAKAHLKSTYNRLLPPKILLGQQYREALPQSKLQNGL